MSGILLACALAGGKRNETPPPSGEMYLVVQYVDDNGAGVVACRHSETKRLLDVLPKATGWVNVRADNYSQAMQRALRLGLRTDGR